MNNLEKILKDNFEKRQKEEREAKILKETHYNNVKLDEETGEVNVDLSVSTAKIPQEPNFIKLYLNDVVVLNGLQPNNSSVLYELLNLMAYGSNIINITKYQKDQIRQKLKLKTVGQIDNALSKLKQKGILLTVKDEQGKVQRGTFEVNPYLFGRGKWVENYQSRSYAKMTILYKKDEKGKVQRTISTEFEEEKGGSNE